MFRTLISKTWWPFEPWCNGLEEISSIWLGGKLSFSFSLIKNYMSKVFKSACVSNFQIKMIFFFFLFILFLCSRFETIIVLDLCYFHFEYMNVLIFLAWISSHCCGWFQRDCLRANFRSINITVQQFLRLYFSFRK